MLRGLVRPLVIILLAAAAACGDDGAPTDGGVDSPDADLRCQPVGAVGQFIRRNGNPRLTPPQTFTDGKLDTELADADVHWNAAASRWELYYAGRHATAYDADDGVGVIRHATSADRMTWTVDDAPVLEPGAAGAWDSLLVGAPTVVENPAAPAASRYLMLYAGAKETFPFPGYARPGFQIGAAVSADGVTFTRVPAASAPGGEDGLVLTGAQVFPNAAGAIVSDPDVVVVDGVYHVFFSSFSCRGADCATVETTGVAHASSTDGIHWNVVEAPVRSLLRATADPTSGGAQPSVIYDAAHCRWELWLSNDLPADTTAQPVDLANTAGVWHTASSDGAAWDSINYAFARDLTWSASQPGEELGMRAGGDVGANGSGRLMLFVGYDGDGAPSGATLPLRTGGTTPGVFALNVATRDLP
jgi:predicted GH43/DUF377 family glycosyl hydrolase